MACTGGTVITRRGLHLHPLLSRDVCPLTPFIIWVPREGKAKEELKNSLLPVAATKASDTDLDLD